MPRKKSAGLPTRKQILDFIASSDQPAGKREIARAFGLSGQTKIDLKRLLKDMADEGLIDSSPGRAFHQAGGVPKVTVLRVVAVDDGGSVWAIPEQWHAEGPAPKLRPVMPRTITRPPVMYSQAWSPTPSTTAVAPEFRTQKRSPTMPRT